MLGEGLGIAAALAALSQAPLQEISDTAMPQIQEILRYRRDGQLQITGHPTWTNEQLASSELLKRDDDAIQRLRTQATDFSLL
jgi:hypothetical protein